MRWPCWAACIAWRSSLRLPQHAQCLVVAEGVERLDGAVAREEAAGLFDEAGGEHGGGTLVEALVKFLARRVEADAQQAEAGQGIAGHDLRERLACGNADLDGADELGRVVGVDARGGGGIEAGEKPMQPGGAVFLNAELQSLAQIGLPRRAGKEAFGEGAQVEAGSAGDDGEALARSYLSEGLTGKTAVVAGGERAGRDRRRR